MNSHIQNLQQLCQSNPALRNLLQFDVNDSIEIASLSSSLFYYYIFYNKTDDNYLLKYLPRKTWPAQDAEEGYVRCVRFDDVLEALNDELAETLDTKGFSGFIKELPAETLWLSLRPNHIASLFRARFTQAIELLHERYSQLQGKKDYRSYWLGFLNNLALSA